MVGYAEVFLYQLGNSGECPKLIRIAKSSCPLKKLVPEVRISAGKRDETVGEGEVWRLRLSRRILLPLASSESLMSEKNLLDEPPLSQITPLSREISPFFSVSPMPLDFLLASYSILYLLSFRKQGLINYIGKNFLKKSILI